MVTVHHRRAAAAPTSSAIAASCRPRTQRKLGKRAAGLLALALLVCLLAPAAAAGARALEATDPTGWTWVVPRPSYDLLDVCCPDAAQHVWAVGKGGTIVTSSNGGVSWGTQSSGTTNWLSGVDFVGAGDGWVVGYGGKILTTVNGGTTWDPQPLPPSSTTDLMDVAFVSATRGWAVGRSGTILFTDSGGKGSGAWVQQGVGVTPQALRCVAFTSPSHGYAVGDAGTILVTDNTGVTWTEQQDPAGTGTTVNFCGVAFSDANDGWAVGYDASDPNWYGVILVTTDGGVTWTRQGPTSGMGRLMAVACTDASHAWAVGETGTIKVTSNGGANWYSQNALIGNTFYGVAFSNMLNGWVVGDSGVAMTTTTGGYPPSTDTTPPTTTLTGADDLWHAGPVALTLLAVDDAGGSGMVGGLAKTEYKLDAGAWTSGTSLTVPAPADHSGDGIHTVSYRSSDAAGNTEAVKSATVKIDTRQPTSTATKSVTVKKGRKATLVYKVSDPAPSCGTATVTIAIKLKAKTVKTIKIANAAANKARSYTFKVTLKKGSYTWTVKATDVAGNVGKASAAKKLIVK